MTIDEIKAKIVFTERPGEHGLRWHRAELNFAEAVATHHLREELPPEYLKEIRNNLTQKLLAKLYDNRRREVLDSIVELYKTNPFSISAQHEAIDKIMALLRYAPPTET